MSVLRVANCSGFLGDRLSAMREVLEGGEVDVVTGDYLAELTLLILGRQRLKDADAGYARTFLRQLDDCLGLAMERGVKVVSNAGGLNPAGLAEAVRALGTGARVAVVDGDDLLERWDGLVGGERPLTANAYLGAAGITAALAGGADVVVTGRVTDASLVVGPAAWHHGWRIDGRHDLDALAGATAVGHVLECGTQATGGNYSFAAELPVEALDAIGFPLAEIAADGSAVVTKHPGTGGVVSVETVTEQLLYECTGVRYGGPDVVTRFDALRLEQVGPDRVRLSGAVGEPPSGRLKVSTNRLGGFRNSVTVPLVGLDVEHKAAVLRRQLAPVLDRVAEASVVLTRTDVPDAGTEQQAAAVLQVHVKDPDPTRVGRAFTAPVVELALASVPGFFVTAPPGDATPYGVYADAWVDAADVPPRVDGRALEVSRVDPAAPAPLPAPDLPAPPTGPTLRVPLGRVAGARSGDKGGTCTLGVYARTDAGFAWLADHLDEARLLALLPEATSASRELLPHLRAVLFQLPGLLGDGVAAGTRFDPQAKAVGEWLRSRSVDVPEELLA